MGGLLAPENLPFAVAFVLLALLVVVQVTGLSDLLGDPDGPDADIDAGSALASMSGIGTLPFIVWFSFFLATFALVGLSLQQLAASFFGSTFGPGAATALGLLAAWPTNTVVTRLVSRIWPHDETTAVPVDALVGKRGTVQIGKATRGSPARVAVRDVHGHTHLVMAEPHEDNVTLGEGAHVLLVRRDGELFYAIDADGPLMLS